MSVSLAPPVRFKAFYPGTGNPLAGGKVWTLQPGTSGFGYLKASYADAGGLVVNANPVVLDASGEADVWLSGYTKLVLQDAAGNLVWSRDNVSSSPAAGAGAGQWISQALLLTYVNGTQFSSPGDQTGLFQTGMRVQAIVSAGTLYGTVTASASTGSPLATIVTVAWDSGALDRGLSAVSTGILTPLNSSLPAPPVYISNYASLTSAVAAVGAAPMSLLVNVPTTVTAATTVPQNISVSVAEGGCITEAGGTLTINGPFLSDGQAFSGFAPGQVTGLTEARPEWWGGAADNATLNTSPFACAAAAVAGAQGKVVLGPGVYRGSMCVRQSNITIEGAGSSSTTIKLPDAAGAEAPIVLELGNILVPTAYNNINVRGLTLDGNRANTAVPTVDTLGWGMAATDVSDSAWEDVRAVNCWTGGHLITSSTSGSYGANNGTLYAASCGHAAGIGGDASSGYYGVDIESSDNNNIRAVVKDCQSGVRLNANCHGNVVDAVITNCTFGGLNLSANGNPSVVQYLYGNTVRATINGGCTNGGVILAGNVYSCQVDAVLTGVTGPGVISLTDEPEDPPT